MDGDVSCDVVVVDRRRGVSRDEAGTGWNGVSEGRVRHGSLKYTQNHAVAVEL